MPFKPLKIGLLSLKNNLIAAPMAGLSSFAYRLLAIEQGCALAFSEMVASEGLIRAHAKTRQYFVNSPKARPFGVQLFGANADAFSESVKILEDEPVDLLDINMGCPVRKVCSKGAGAALMKSPENVKKIVTAVRAATKRPFTVKIRSGWDDSSFNCVQIAKIAEDAGADAIIIHARTREQMFKGKANWQHIAEVKSKIKIPVIGNGDVKDHLSAIAMLNESGCDGIMIGRAAVGNPWIFAQILDPSAKAPTMMERGEAVLRHMKNLCNVVGERTTLANMRTMLSWYTHGIVGTKKFMQEVHKIKELKELETAIGRFFGLSGQ